MRMGVRDILRANLLCADEHDEGGELGPERRDDDAVESLRPSAWPKSACAGRGPSLTSWQCGARTFSFLGLLSQQFG